MASILVVDDERSMRELLEIMLSKQGHAVVAVDGAAEALRRVSQGGIDLVLTDLKLGRNSGLDVLRGCREASPGTEVIVITAYASTENAVQAMKLGAYDYVLKPFKIDELSMVVAKALEHRALLAENRALRHRVDPRATGRPLEILGRSAAIQDVRDTIAKVALKPTTVLLTGESGSGKEVVAQAIHALGRPDQPFVPVNCGAIPEGLVESELFGHEKGSFTGATDQKAGLFEVAGSGTIFLDEVGELSLQLQVKLLRALQERCFRRVGAKVDIPFAARIIAATNRDLAGEVRAGRFREDLFYRLDVINIHVPSLRERREDIPAFIEHFLQRFAMEVGRPLPRLSPEAERLLAAHDYPGNVRELANVVERAVTLSDGDVLDAAALPPAVRGAAALAAAPPEVAVPEEGLDLQAHLDRIERGILEQALARTGGVKTEAARLLSLTFRSLRYRLAKYGIGDR